MSAVLHPDTRPVGVNLNTAATAEAALGIFWGLAEARKILRLMHNAIYFDASGGDENNRDD